MNLAHEKILSVQKESWNKSSAGWKKWDDMMMRFLKPVGEEMIRMLNLKKSEHVLDVATGTGEPGLTIASLVPEGKVVATDLSEEMLDVAAAKATARGIENFEPLCCSSTDLPFSNNSFDAITCRFSLMFFPDMHLGLNEMTRVLKPGGKIAVSVWNEAERNFWVSNSMEIIIRTLQLNPPGPGSPGMFRCAQPGMMAELFRQCGLTGIHEKEVTGKLHFDNSGTYWNFISEVASPMAFTKADESVKLLIKEEAIGRLVERYNDADFAIGSSATVICGTK